MDSNIYDFFKDISQRHTLRDISASVDVNIGTVNRWKEKKEVPSQYYFDLCRLDGIPIDYTQFTEKEKDQFYTSKKSSEYCFNKTIEVLSGLGIDLREYNYIEPSAGDGSFYSLLPEDRRVGVDIEPKCGGVIQSDFLSWKPVSVKNICVGNPPFGLRGNLALKFINHASTFSDFVCFVLPQLFDSDGKGSCKSRVRGLNLIHSEIIGSDFYYPSGKEVKVNVVFQIWSKYHQIEKESFNLDGIIKLYSLSDGGTPGSTRNKKYLYSCDYYLPSTCFGEGSMKVYNDFESLPHRRGYGIIVKQYYDEIDEIMKSIDWVNVSFPSTNGAYNLRFDLIEKSIGKHLNLETSHINVEKFMLGGEV